MDGKCIRCGEVFVKTGQNHKRCSECTKQTTKEATRKASWKHAVKTGRIKKPGIGSGNSGKREEHPSYVNGISWFTMYRKDCCERCGSTKFLCAHHKDYDRTNNIESNIETLCKSCHQKEHKTHKNFTKGKTA